MTFSSRYRRIGDNLLAPCDAPPFTYSDGDVENYIAEVISNVSDRSLMSPELLSKIKDWPTLYHLSFRRSFLLRPVRHLLEGKTVLELGAGCGALTRYLGENAASVVALEGSPRRAGITAVRCQDIPSVTVVNDSIQDLELAEKFDVVTLLGVLEYARAHGPQVENPEAALLAIAKSFLKPGGLLLLAIENQLGLKYFAGVPEDHLGRPFFGIQDLYTDKTPVTFGRSELLKLLRSTGFSAVEQLVPLPDYKFPITVLYPSCFEREDPEVDVTPFIQNSYRADNQKAPYFCFSLEAATRAVVRNGLVRDLCNSFFFIASDQPGARFCKPDRYVAHYGTVRALRFEKETLVVRQEGALRVTREYTAPENMRPKEAMAGNTIEDEPYLPYPLYHEGLITIMNTPGWNRLSVAGWAKKWVEFLQSKTKDGQLPGRFQDATPLNCAVSPKGECVLFDQEWAPKEKETVPLSFVVFRGLFYTLSWFETVAPPSENTPLCILDLIVTVMGRLGLPLTRQSLDEYLGMEEEFQIWAAGFITPKIPRGKELKVRLIT